MALNLTKGDKLNLVKNNGQALNNICVGLNWGAIVKSGIFGTSKEAVDLDSSAAVFNAQGELIDAIYFGKLSSDDKAILHSGDDLTGDLDGDDDLDNEIISVQLSKVRQDADKVIFILNSYRGHDFATIPYAHLRIYEGTPKRVDSIFAQFNVATEPKYKGTVSMIMGKLYRYKGEWKFETIGEPTQDKKLQDTINTAKRLYL
jgi:tellurium resistance protein TerZ